MASNEANSAHERDTPSEVVVFLEKVQIDTGQFVLNLGATGANRSTALIDLVIRDRATGESIYSKIARISDQWKAVVGLENVPNDGGVADFYAVCDQGGERVVKRVKLSGEPPPYVAPEKVRSPGTALSFYKTIKGSLSATVAPRYIQMLTLNIGSEGTPIIIDFSHDVDTCFSRSDCEFVFKNKRQKLLYTDSVKVNTSPRGNTVTSVSELPELIPNVNYRVLLKTSKGIFRFRVTGDIQWDKKYVYTSATNSLFFFYKNKKDELGLAARKPVLKRDISDVTLSTEGLAISGQAWVGQTKGFSHPLCCSIVIFSRVTKKTISLPIDTVDRRFSLFIGYDRLQPLMGPSKNVFDFFINVRFSATQFLERRLGYRQFDYWTDCPVNTIIVQNNQNSRFWSTTLTPGGNLKLETVQYRTNVVETMETQRARLNHCHPDAIWIIGERPDTAQDTGYHFFRFMRTVYPNRNVFYAINPDSKDKENVLPLGNVLFIGSDAHLNYTAEASAFLGSHDLEYILPVKPWHIDSYKRGLRVFLQHGVLGRKTVEYNRSFYAYPFHLFVVSSDRERRLVVDQLGYPPEDVVVTGLSRFDALMDAPSTKSGIIVIPTWREWITTPEQLVHSEYYRRWLSFLTNPKLTALLKAYDVQLDFVLHYRMQALMKQQDVQLPAPIRITRYGDTSIQKLLMKHAYMITDYSSVSFDFYYMKKPVSFYHFDWDRFFRKGIMLPRDETFLGDICHTEAALIEAVKKTIENGFAKTLTRDGSTAPTTREHCFAYMDNKNCNRILEAILNRRNL